MNGHSEKYTCIECGKCVFHQVDGRQVCSECLTVVPDHIEEECDEIGPRNQSIYTPSLKNQATKTAKQTKLAERNKLIQEWCLYDGFNFILIKMTDALIRCGANPKIKPCVHQLWAAYLARINIAYCESPSSAPVNKEQEEEAIINEEESILPNWFSQTTDQGSQEGSKKNDEPKDLLFAPKKMAITCRTYYRKKDLLVDTPDEVLSMAEKRLKRRKIKSSFMKLALSGADTDIELAESLKEAKANAQRRTNVYQLPRMYTMKHAVPECFPEGELYTDLLRAKKTKDYTAPKTTYTDPEYMTLHKLLSFLHAALLMKGEVICYGDITRWVREGHIPLYAAHRLLPSTMPLSRTDSLILGGLSASRSDGAPASRIFRQNTARLLTILNVPLVPKPPAYLLASKVIRDLQLPDELIVFVRHFDKLVSQNNLDEWKLSPFGNRVDRQSIYAATLVLVAIKFVMGLDGTTEYKISDFAAKYNELLKLKPSSGFSRRQASAENEITVDGSHQRSDGKPLFVWREWVRFIEYRRVAIERTHVPTAIRKELLDRMDPEYILRYAENEGFLFCNSSTEEPSEKEKVLLSFIEKLSENYPKPFTPTKRIPSFHPSLLGSHGLAEQLIEFDESKYGLLKQDFSSSSLVFARNPRVLASALKKANPPHSLKIQKGPAYKEARLTTPFINSRCAVQKNASRTPYSETNRYGYKMLELNPEIVPVPAMSDEEGEDDDDNFTQPEPSLLLFQPSSVYWTTSAIAKLMSFNEWDLFSAGLPTTFVWMLKLICESIEESPRDFYIPFNYVETLIMFRNTELKHTLSDCKTMKRRLVGALRTDI
ncbi:TATA box-binding protein-associated factor RNA polymerase I subunit B-like isoform X2 [Daphnia carinata]|uniref:TATA box-binding protein-associated factor RNA polymerase I subunit B-like isoform X2 n=1 Tax=Daphnia carinata TaxID=120202 RepID=UPI00257B4E76|nr:TATA box-binding protein-associated factor RNA polymerase I subunit B-like isoform X2 [Daphnia carinata]